MENDGFVLSDAEFLFAEKTLLHYLTTVQAVAKELVELLRSLMEHALSASQISQRLEAFVVLLAQISEQAGCLSDTLSGNSAHFIEEIDQQDQFMY